MNPLVVWACQCAARPLRARLLRVSRTLSGLMFGCRAPYRLRHLGCPRHGFSAQPHPSSTHLAQPSQPPAPAVPRQPSCPPRRAQSFRLSRSSYLVPPSRSASAALSTLSRSIVPPPPFRLPRPVQPSRTVAASRPRRHRRQADPVQPSRASRRSGTSTPSSELFGLAQLGPLGRPDSTSLSGTRFGSR